MKKHLSIAISFVFFFILIIVVHEIMLYKKNDESLKRHSTFLVSGLLEQNIEMLRSNVKLLLDLETYHEVTLYNIDGDKIIRIKEIPPKPSLITDLDNFFCRYYKTTIWIEHKGDRIGKFETVFCNRNVYSYFTVFVVLLMIYLFMLQILKSSKKTRLMQSQLIQAAKLAALGELASGIAHELNNPLTGVVGFAEAIRRKPEDLNKVTSKAEKIINIGKRMKAIVDHIREFSREATVKDWKQLKINKPIRNAFILMETQIKVKNIEIELNLDEDVQYMWGDTNKLESIFQNLISNSRDAFRDVTDDRKFKISFTTSIAGDKVKVVYKDNAGGMPESVQEKIFDPFFTTKSIGKGTGLGMSVTHGIVQEHKGKIILQSEIPQGTTFEFLFPVDLRENVPREEESQQEIISDIVQKDAKKLELLVIDDEELVCEVLEDFLSDYFEVRCVQDSLKGIEMVEEGRDFSIILCDLEMPGMTGVEVVAALHNLGLKIPVVVLTGHDSKDPAVIEAMDKGAVGVLTKPFINFNEIKAQIKMKAKTT